MKIIPMLQSWIMRKEGGMSWSKAWAWITGALASIVVLNAQLVEMGIAIPAEMLPYFKFAATASALITAIRIRNTIKQTPATPSAEGK